MSRLRAIAAVSENGVIGNAGAIPWHLPADFRWFRSVTWGGILIQGRKTFESIGKPLPGRETWVLSRSPVTAAGVRPFVDLDSVRIALASESRPAWLCGGGELYRQWLPECSDLFLTRIHRTVDGDALFPAFEGRFRRLAIVFRTTGFHVEHWIRVPGRS